MPGRADRGVDKCMCLSPLSAMTMVMVMVIVLGECGFTCSVRERALEKCGVRPGVTTAVIVAAAVIIAVITRPY